MNAHILSDLHFLRPWCLLILIIIPVLYWYLGRNHAAGGAWRKACDPELLEHLLSVSTQSKRATGRLATCLLLTIMIIALAGPAWQRLPQPVFTQQSALILVLDLSRSMLAEDIKPNRLQWAKNRLHDLLQERQEGQTGLIIFAADAFVITPLTDDIHTIDLHLADLQPDLMPAQGSRIDVALRKAVELFSQAHISSGTVILATDDASETDFQAASWFKSQGHRISILGVGTAQGAPIPAIGGGFVRQAGNIVIPRMDAERLQIMANAGGGIYRHVQGSQSDMRDLLNTVKEDISAEEAADASRAMQSDLWQEEGPWLLLFCLPLLAFMFRRGLIMPMFLLPLCAFMSYAPPAQAMTWQSLWQTPDQQAAQAMQADKLEQAVDLFENSNWKASALYRAGKYEEAAKLWDDIPDTEAQYNRGNALAQAKKYPEAIAAYEQVLQNDKNHADAKHNLAELKKMQQEQQEQQKQDKEEKQGDEGQEQKDGQKSDQSQQAQQEGQQSEESEQQQAVENEDNKEKEADKDDNTLVKKDEQQEDAEDSVDEKKQLAKKEPQFAEMDEEAQARQQWLQRIPDDPGAFWRNKFLYQYKQQQQQHSQEEKQW
ncbi:MAG: VWA domain-containing protein [Mariprofundales bacterium]